MGGVAVRVDIRFHGESGSETHVEAKVTLPDDTFIDGTLMVRGDDEDEDDDVEFYENTTGYDDQAAEVIFKEAVWAAMDGTIGVREATIYI